MSVEEHTPQPEKAAAYAQLVEKFGAERVATAVLTKWLLDTDSDSCWENLAAAVSVKQGLPSPAPKRMALVHKYWVVLWYISMGYSMEGCAEQLNLSIETIKQNLKYARKKLGLAGKPLPLVVATAIRQGWIP